MSTATSPAAGRSVPQARAGSGLPTRERRPRYVALAAVLLVGGTAAGSLLYARAGAKTPVVIVVSKDPIPAGQTIERSDLSTVAVAGSITAIAGENLDSVIGQAAAVPLLPNMLLQRSMLTAAADLGPQEAEVGVAVTSGRMPADGLAPGDTVTVLQLPDDQASSPRSAPAPEELVAQARVFAARADPAQAGGTLLTLTVPSSRAAAVAAASGAGTVALVRVAAGS